MQPIDYRINAPNLGESAIQGYGMGQEIMARKAAQKRQAQMQEDLGNFAVSKTKTAEDYDAMRLKYPEISKQIDSSWKNFSAVQKKNKIDQLMSIYVPLKSGNIEASKARIDEAIEANRNSGNELDAKNLETLRDNIDIDKNGAITSAELFLSQADPEKFKTTFESMKLSGEESRAKEIQPEEVKLKKAEVVKAGLDAGLTQQETLKTIAQSKKLDAETQQIIVELEGLKKGGLLSTDKKVDLEQKLADRYYSRNADYVERVGAYKNLVESAKQDSGPGDMALIMAFNKMLDPRSVVRESEFAMAEISSGRLQNFLNQWTKFKKGDRLKPKQRQKFLDLAKKYLEAAENSEVLKRQHIEKTIDAYGLNKDIVLPEREKVEATILEGAEKKQPKTSAGIDVKTASTDDLLQGL